MGLPTKNTLSLRNRPFLAPTLSIGLFCWYLELPVYFVRILGIKVSVYRPPLIHDVSMKKVLASQNHRFGFREYLVGSCLVGTYYLLLYVYTCITFKTSLLLQECTTTTGNHHSTTTTGFWFMAKLAKLGGGKVFKFSDNRHHRQWHQHQQRHCIYAYVHMYGTAVYCLLTLLVLQCTYSVELTLMTSKLIPNPELQSYT